MNEGKAKIIVSTANVVSKDLEVFYNPLMKFNRDITIEILKNFFDFPFIGALPLAGSGVRGARLLLDMPMKELLMNDLNPKAIKQIKKNLKLNEKEIKKIQGKSFTKIVKICQSDANVFLRSNGKYDYIDVDPFGSSVPFLDSAIISLKNNSVLAVTNTDTAALCGSYPKVSQRRYGFKPFNHAIRQEFGLRALIKKIQEIGFMHDKALLPICSFSKDHYMRVFLKCTNSKELCENLMKETGFVKADDNRLFERTSLCEGQNIFGPIFLGKLQDEDFLNKIMLSKDIYDKSTISFFDKIKQDSKLDSLFYFFDPHEICKLNTWSVPNYSYLIEEIEKKGFKVLRTHYYSTAILSNIDKNDFVKILKKAVLKSKN